MTIIAWASLYRKESIMEIKIKGKKSQAVISTLGAQLMSFTKDGKEYIWNGDERYWKGRAPLLFPFVGGLRNNKALICGKEYEMTRHGFIRFMEFEVKEQGENFVTMRFTANEETLKMYPFNFTFDATLMINQDDSILSRLTVTNTDEKVMPFTIGQHTGYAVPNDIYNTCVITFEKEETVNYPANVLENGLIDTDIRTPFLKNERTFTLNHGLFDKDAIICDGVKSRSVTLESPTTSLKFRVDFPDFDNVIFWAIKGEAPYVCIEPVIGYCTTETESDIFEDKAGMIKLSPNESRSFDMVITPL